MWTEELEWTGRQTFGAEELKPCRVDGEEAGLVYGAKGDDLRYSAWSRTSGTQRT